MAPSQTTTLRVPTDLRDEIARIAEVRGTTMLEVVADAIHRLTREQWWNAVHDALEAMTPVELAAYHVEADRLGGATADGIRG